MKEDRYQERRERRCEQTLDLLNVWAGIGVFGRAVVVIAIIAALGYIGWSLLTLATFIYLTAF